MGRGKGYLSRVSAGVGMHRRFDPETDMYVTCLVVGLRQSSDIDIVQLACGTETARFHDEQIGITTHIERVTCPDCKEAWEYIEEMIEDGR